MMAVWHALCDPQHAAVSSMHALVGMAAWQSAQLVDYLVVVWQGGVRDSTLVLQWHQTHATVLIRLLWCFVAVIVLVLVVQCVFLLLMMYWACVRLLWCPDVVGWRVTRDGLTFLHHQLIPPHTWCCCCTSCWYVCSHLCFRLLKPPGNTAESITRMACVLWRLCWSRHSPNTHTSVMETMCMYPPITRHSVE